MTRDLNSNLHQSFRSRGKPLVGCPLIPFDGPFLALTHALSIPVAVTQACLRVCIALLRSQSEVLDSLFVVLLETSVVKKITQVVLSSCIALIGSQPEIPDGLFGVLLDTFPLAVAMT